MPRDEGKAEDEDEKGEGKRAEAAKSGEKFEALIDEIKHLLFSDASFEDEVRRFCERGCERIEVPIHRDPGDDQPLEFMALHQEFSALFEERVTDVLQRCGFSNHEFYEKLQKMAEEDEDSEEQAFLATLLAIIDYESFVILLREPQRGERWSLLFMFSR